MCYITLFTCFWKFKPISFCFKALEKLKRQLAEAEAALESRKKPPEEIGTKIVGEGLVIDEWVSSQLNFKSLLNFWGIFSNVFICVLYRKREEKDTWPDSRLKALTRFNNKKKMVGYFLNLLSSFCIIFMPKKISPCIKELGRRQLWTCLQCKKLSWVQSVTWEVYIVYY